MNLTGYITLKRTLESLDHLSDLLSAWAAVSLFRKSLFNSLFTKSIASGDKDGHGASSKPGSAFRTARKMPDSVRAQKGLLPHKRM